MIIDGWQLRFPRTGLGNVTAHLIRELVAQGHGPDTHVIVPGDVKLDHWELPTSQVGWKVIPGPFARTDYVARWRWSRAFSKLVREHHLDQKVFIPYLYAHFPLRKQSLVFVPDLVYKAHPFHDSSATSWWNIRKRLYLRRCVMRCEEWLVAQASRWITSSQFVAGDVERELGIPRDKITVSTLGPGPIFPRWNPKGRSVRPADVLGGYVFYVGGYGHRKNVPMLLEACELLLQSEPTFQLMLAGISEAQLLADPRYSHGWNAVRAGSILCLDRPTDQELIVKYAGSRFTVFPSQGEGFGLPLVEAAACGVCTLVADNSSLTDLQPERTLRVPTGDVRAWATAMQWLWNDHVERQRLEESLVNNFAQCSMSRFASDVWTASHAIP